MSLLELMASGTSVRDCGWVGPRCVRREDIMASVSFQNEVTVPLGIGCLSDFRVWATALALASTGWSTAVANRYLSRFSVGDVSTMKWWNPTGKTLGDRMSWTVGNGCCAAVTNLATGFIKSRSRNTFTDRRTSTTSCLNHQKRAASPFSTSE